jgi:hypothetical protein
MSRIETRFAPVLLCLLFLSFSACIEWSTNSQGSLQSIGVPGIPVWQSPELSQQKMMAKEGTLAAQPGSVVDPDAANLVTVNSDDPWLTELNTWRTACLQRYKTEPLYRRKSEPLWVGPILSPCLII